MKGFYTAFLQEMVENIQPVLRRNPSLAKMRIREQPFFGDHPIKHQKSAFKRPIPYERK